MGMKLLPLVASAFSLKDERLHISHGSVKKKLLHIKSFSIKWKFLVFSNLLSIRNDTSHTEEAVKLFKALFKTIISFLFVLPDSGKRL